MSMYGLKTFTRTLLYLTDLITCMMIEYIFAVKILKYYYHYYYIGLTMMQGSQSLRQKATKKGPQLCQVAQHACIHESLKTSTRLLTHMCQATLAN